MGIDENPDTTSDTRVVVAVVALERSLVIMVPPVAELTSPFMEQPKHVSYSPNSTDTTRIVSVVASQAMALGVPTPLIESPKSLMFTKRMRKDITSVDTHLTSLRLQGRLSLVGPPVTPKLMRAIIDEFVLERPPTVLVATETSLAKEFIVNPVVASTIPIVTLIKLESILQEACASGLLVDVPPFIKSSTKSLATPLSPLSDTAPHVEHEHLSDHTGHASGISVRSWTSKLAVCNVHKVRSKT